MAVPDSTPHPLNHPLVSIWLGIIARCHVPSAQSYRHYGGRGVYLDERWMLFTNFAEDMGPRPSPQHSVERRDVNAGYSKENCRWATATEQNRNTRRTHWLTHDGLTLPLPEWAERTGVCMSTLSTRLQRGWPVSLALTTPTTRPGGQARVVARQTKQVCDAAGISTSGFQYRLSEGWSEQDALETSLGHTRPTIALCREAGISTTMFYGRLKRGFTQDEALHTPRRQQPQRLDPTHRRWKTADDASAKKSRTRLLTFQGETMPVTKWAYRLKINPSTLFARLLAGMPPEVALTTKAVRGHVVGQPSLGERLAAAGLKRAAYHARIAAGWTVDEALNTPKFHRCPSRQE